MAAYLAAIFITGFFGFLGVSLPSWLNLSHGFWFLPVSALIGSVIGRFVLSRMAIPALRPFYGAREEVIS